MRASPMACSRIFTSRSRQRFNKCLIETGVAEGSFPKSISPLITSANISEAVPPVKSCCPVNISNSTTPNDQMSARLSTGLPGACSGLI